MSKSRVPLIAGTGLAAGIGYYLYSAGGSPRAAENKVESDAHRAAAEIKSHLPGRSPVDAESDLKGYGQQAGAKLAEADRQAGVAKSNAESYAKDAKAEALKAVDKFDQKVEEGAAKAKGGISGWFGGSSK
ncbi:calcofluor white hypersensitive [Fusarium albosuccineum]|uniref:Calcofluor white hypersensitive n=1 Tax=Fusarium albosuccineum TaxID=1237068 RepID=A0A8H4LDR3_9HYPO|nr:calcofluor white hypersensitive [Fusarium albosuccineum]KAF4986544.1 hypothetical protein FDECE_15895 [Fusarium decemcellulare]